MEQSADVHDIGINLDVYDIEFILSSFKFRNGYPVFHRAWTGSLSVKYCFTLIILIAQISLKY